MKRTLGFLSLLVLAGAAQADNRQGFYVGGGGTFVNSGNERNFSTLEFLGGFKLNSFVGAEMRVGTGLSGSTARETVVGETEAVLVEQSITHYESIYYRMESVNQIAKLYGMLGYSNVGMDFDQYESQTYTGVSWIGGVGFVLSPKSNLNFEVRSVVANGSRDIEGFAMNYDYRF